MLGFLGGCALFVGLLLLVWWIFQWLVTGEQPCPWGPNACL